MKSTRAIIMAAALSVGLILVTSAGATSWHLEDLGVPYIPYPMTMLVSLNLVIIVVLGLVTIIQGNGRPARSREKHSRARFDLNKVHEQPAAQGCVARVDQIIDITFDAASRQRNSREENAQLKADVMLVARHKLRQEDVDACWIRKSSESHY